MRLGYASAHFAWGELACHSGEDVPPELIPNALALCELLEVIREDIQDALIVVSGYRTPAYNRRVGGAEHSRHLTAEAADIRPVNLARLGGLDRLLRERAQTPRYARLGGHGTYSHWVHVDIRPRPPGGHVARWFGSGLGSEKTG